MEMKSNAKEMLEFLKTLEQVIGHTSPKRSISLPTIEQSMYTELASIEAHVCSMHDFIPDSLFDTEVIDSSLKEIKRLLNEVEKDMKKCFERSQEPSGCC